MKKPKIYERCLLVSLGAFGLNELIPNGKDFLNSLKKMYKYVDIISTDKYIKKKKIIRYFFYFLDIFNELIKFKPAILFIHMNTDLAQILIKLQPYKYKKIYCWFSHIKITKSATFVMNKSNRISTASHTVFKKYPESLFSHAIELPKKNQLINYSKKSLKNTRIVFIGRFSKVKNIDIFLDIAMHCYRDNLIDEFKLMAKDHDSIVKKSITSQIKDSNIPNKLRTNSDIIKIYNFLEEGDILVSISKELGINKVMLEAAALGIPVITNSKFFYKFFNMYEELFIENINEFNNFKKVLLNWKNMSLEQKQIKSKKAIRIAKSFNTDNLLREIVSK